MVIERLGYNRLKPTSIEQVGQIASVYLHRWFASPRYDGAELGNGKMGIDLSGHLRLDGRVVKAERPPPGLSCPYLSWAFDKLESGASAG
ncbi:hypothetical protein ElyMa_001199400 [Elysia marginata]|uniref:Uncharacterized protein n=1 Tax=Elysia marginata TaxID=1093978 RepID=A0AAV4I795_9GAST|nr:hypothetical protein ElyMa_001199400 [Elysia marginata]